MSMSSSSENGSHSSSEDTVPDVSWHSRKFQQIDNQTLYLILQLRSQVFVVEQHCLYLDADGADTEAHHIYARLVPTNLTNAPIELVAYCRILPPNSEDQRPSIGRVLVSGAFRGHGFAKQLMIRALDECHLAWPGATVKMSAQHYLVDFYRSFGFLAVGESYLEDGIPHVQMVYEPKKAKESS